MELELCFSYIPLAKLRARMIRNNWQVLRHEKERANELVTSTNSLRRSNSHSSVLLFYLIRELFSVEHRTASKPARPIVSAFQQITDSHATHRSLATHRLCVCFFFENNLLNGTNDGRFYCSKSSTGKEENRSRLSNNNKHSPKFDRAEASGETDVHVVFSHFFNTEYLLSSRWGLFVVYVIERSYDWLAM